MQFTIDTPSSPEIPKKKKGMSRILFCLCFPYRDEPTGLILPKKKEKGIYRGNVSIVYSTDRKNSDFTVFHRKLSLTPL